MDEVAQTRDIPGLLHRESRERTRMDGRREPSQFSDDLMGASMALAGVTSCNRASHSKILP